MNDISEQLYLTPKELVIRYRNAVTLHTLANWRSHGDGPPHTKIGGRVLYPVTSLFQWEHVRSFFNSLEHIGLLP